MKGIRPASVAALFTVTLFACYGLEQLLRRARMQKSAAAKEPTPSKASAPQIAIKSSAKPAHPLYKPNNSSLRASLLPENRLVEPMQPFFGFPAPQTAGLLPTNAYMPNASQLHTFAPQQHPFAPAFPNFLRNTLVGHNAAMPQPNHIALSSSDRIASPPKSSHHYGGHTRLLESIKNQLTHLESRVDAAIERIDTHESLYHLHDAPALTPSGVTGEGATHGSVLDMLSHSAKNEHTPLFGNLQLQSHSPSTNGHVSTSPHAHNASSAHTTAETDDPNLVNIKFFENPSDLQKYQDEMVARHATPAMHPTDEQTLRISDFIGLPGLPPLPPELSGPPPSDTFNALPSTQPVGSLSLSSDRSSTGKDVSAIPLQSEFFPGLQVHSLGSGSGSGFGSASEHALQEGPIEIPLAVLNHARSPALSSAEPLRPSFFARSPFSGLPFEGMADSGVAHGQEDAAAHAANLFKEILSAAMLPLLTGSLPEDSCKITVDPESGIRTKQCVHSRRMSGRNSDMASAGGTTKIFIPLHVMSNAHEKPTLTDGMSAAKNSQSGSAHKVGEDLSFADLGNSLQGKAAASVPEISAEMHPKESMRAEMSLGDAINNFNSPENDGELSHIIPLPFFDAPDGFSELKHTARPADMLASRLRAFTKAAGEASESALKATTPNGDVPGPDTSKLHQKDLGQNSQMAGLATHVPSKADTAGAHLKEAVLAGNGAETARHSQLAVQSASRQLKVQAALADAKEDKADSADKGSEKDNDEDSKKSDKADEKSKSKLSSSVRNASLQLHKAETNSRLLAQNAPPTTSFLHDN